MWSLWYKVWVYLNGKKVLLQLFLHLFSVTYSWLSLPLSCPLQLFLLGKPPPFNMIAISFTHIYRGPFCIKKIHSTSFIKSMSSSTCKVLVKF